MLKRNIIANYGGAGFVAFTQVILIPLYLRYLGENQWGVLSIVVALSGAFLVLEAGLSLAVARSFSNLSSDQAPTLARLRRLERRYVAAASLIVGISVTVAPLVANLVLPSIPTNKVILFVLASAMASGQIIGSLYRSVLLGIGAQVHFNVLLVGFTALRHVAGVGAAMHRGSAVEVTAVFASCFLLEALARRVLVTTFVRHSQLEHDHASAVASVAPMGALPLALAGAGGALSTQIDRLILSQTIDPASIGHYAIAVTLSLAALQLVYPLCAALLPRLDRFAIAQERTRIMRHSYLMLTILLVVVWLVAAILIAGPLKWWLGSETLASLVVPLFIAHLVGTSLNALCVPLYLALLACRIDRGILIANLIALSAQAGVLLCAALQFGAMTGSLSWCAANGVLCATYFFFVRAAEKWNDRTPHAPTSP